MENKHTLKSGLLIPHFSVNVLINFYFYIYLHVFGIITYEVYTVNCKRQFKGKMASYMVNF